jgi:hypothetical protein
LIRRSIELFGEKVTEKDVFPALNASEILIRPPEKIAFSSQLIQGYKTVQNKNGIVLQSSIIHRDYACAFGTMTIFINCPIGACNILEQLFLAIGYWGQANSFTQCITVEPGEPKRSQCVQDVKKMTLPRSQNYHSCYLTELASIIKWSDLYDEDLVLISLYVWPLIEEDLSGKTILVRRPFSDG